MQNEIKLRTIKIIHTAVWVFFNVVIFYMLYAVLVNKIDIWLWVCYGLILLEGLTLLAFKLYCPLTVMARKYSGSTKENFDIYLPNWLAKYNKQIYTSSLIANGIAFPLAWWAASKWLQEYAYHIEIQWWVFVAAGISACLIALITVSYQAIKAALANPVKSLRTE